VKLKKVTKQRENADKRRYDDACGLAHALDLIGERWAMLVLRELAYGPRRFSELRADLPGISANVLTQRLTELEHRGVLKKVTLPPPASVQVYEATPWGLEAAPLIGALGKWAARSPLHDPTLPMSHAALMMSFQTLFDPARAKEMNARVGFRFGNIAYVAAVADERIAIARRDPENVDATLSGTPTDVAAVIHGGAPTDLIKIQGDMAVAKRFMTLFPLPEKVETS
jgi:DNA-binding HxlR family transcriptional regulator